METLANHIKLGVCLAAIIAAGTCSSLSRKAPATRPARTATATPTVARPTSTIVPPIPPAPSPTLEGPLAEVIARLDTGGGSAAFDAMIYGQEVNTGATFHVFMSVGDHHAEAVHRTDPVTLFVRAPGTYVFYARLTYVPDLYYWGFTGCPALGSCGGARLKAIDVAAGGVYEVLISGRDAQLPMADVPVDVPWSR